MPPPYSVEVGDEEPAPGESRPRRASIHPDRLTERPFEGIDTPHDVLLHCARVHGTKDAYGWRDIVDTHEEKKQIKKMVDGKEVTQEKSWMYWQLSDYKYYSFIQMKDAVAEAAKGFLEAGIEKGAVFNIYATTSVNWQIMAHACFQTSTTIATAYDSLGESGLLHALNEPECAGVFTNADLLPTLAKIIGNATTIRLVVYDGNPAQSDLDKLRAEKPDLKLLSIDDLRALGKDKPATNRAPTKDDLACIMYTSGTTGPPKGVMLTHANLIAAVGAIYDLLGDELKPADSFLAFLPLAHILELIVELALSFLGMTIGYGRVKTLTDASVRNCLGDLRAFRPTIMVGVPAVWETIRKGIVGKVNSGGALKKAVFNGALSVKRASVPVLQNIVEAVVFSQVKQQTGGRLRLALSGGASLSRETQEFLTLALVRIIQGYGLTESVGMACLMSPATFNIGSAGPPVPAVEIKFKDHPEAGYYHTSNPPCGEILLRGPSVTKGYFKRDDLNNDPEIFTKDGFFRTGDIGQWNPDGTLSVIDRIKNLVKLQGGEYIALERLEATYKSCNLVANICVYADAEAKQPIAIICPHEANLRHALDSSHQSKDFRELCHDPAVTGLILTQCNAVGKKSGFKSIEVLQGVVLTADEWTPESELVTAAQKLQRRKIAERYRNEIQETYRNTQS
ncbi:acetyl-CoA synthetase-like protein [Hysterangium stoloniferum]|nr:acetyl-CoA synthetase-like protein [Hysterangium stoloniferum]